MNILLPEFCRTPLTGKIPAPIIIPHNHSCLLEICTHEHCLGSAPA
jgi:hypothetical protein